MSERLVELTKELIKVNTGNPPGNEEPVVEILAERMKKLGNEVNILEAAKGRPNLLSIWKGEGSKKLVLMGHTDTIPAGERWVHDPFGGIVENNRIYGRGSADMKGSLAAMVIAMEELKEEGWNPKGELMFLACCNEEMGDPEGIGMSYVVDKINADLMIIGDVSDFNIIIAEKGLLWLEFTSVGKDAHGAMPWLGVNAIENLGKFLIKMKEDLKFSVRHPLLEESTLSINTIS